jgi:hypothetical protein
MAKTVAPIADLKVQCHCAFDTFVSRVDQRVKHSSGLAIHDAPLQPLNSAAQRTEPRHKSKFYKAAEKAYNERGKPNQELLKNLARKKAIGAKLAKRVQRAAKQRSRWGLVKVENCPHVDVPPDPIRMAQFRYRFLVQFTPEELFGTN